jgi:hypothetical protein
MKTERITLTSWDWMLSESENYLDIPWPKVQRAIGEDHLKWLLKQPGEYCQLVVDRYGTTIKLVAEFYDEKTLTTYHLMWAK